MAFVSGAAETCGTSVPESEWPDAATRILRRQLGGNVAVEIANLRVRLAAHPAANKVSQLAQPPGHTPQRRTGVTIYI